MIRRYPAALGPALLVTFALFWSMQALVHVEWLPTIPSVLPTIDIVRVKREPVVPKPDPRPQRLVMPVPLPLPSIPSGDSGVPLALLGTPDPIPVVDPKGAGAFDRSAVPRVRMEPAYPPHARESGIEGWATVEFTISAVGRVEGARIVESHPGTVFDRSTLDAVRRWLYEPRIQDGEAVDQHSVRVTLRYTIDR